MLNKSLIYVILTTLCAFALSLTLGWILIPMLRRLKAGQEIREVGPNWHATKAGTPTMGGLTFIGGSFLCLVFGVRTAEPAPQTLPLRRGRRQHRVDINPRIVQLLGLHQSTH